MNTILPPSRKVRNAIQWISTEIESHGEDVLRESIRSSINKFDLSPMEADFLYGFYKDYLKKKD